MNEHSQQVYITGHGGDGFMKFQDKEEVTSDEIGAAFALVREPCVYSCSHQNCSGPQLAAAMLAMLCFFCSNDYVQCQYLLLRHPAA